MNSRNFCCCLTLVLTIVTASLSAQSVTHMGVGPLEHVTLEACGLSALCMLAGFHRSLPDGSTAVGEFVIPERHVLVVTDVDWNLNGKSNFDWFLAGRSVVVSLTRINDSTQAKNQPFRSTATIETTNFCDPVTDCEEDISAGANTQMTSGFVVSSGSHLRLDVQFDDLGLLNERFFQIKVRGYLLPIE